MQPTPTPDDHDPVRPTEDRLEEPDASSDGSQLEEGIACCLSGGGFRASIFHLGGLWRLNQAGLLREVKRFSSVSGGSITSAVLGMNWHRLVEHEFSEEAFIENVVNPIRGLCSTTIDVPAVGWGSLNPFRRISDIVASHYDAVFQGKTLQDLPDEPRWVFNATNVKTGVLWRFSKPYMGDYLVGLVDNPKVALADAVAASTAFPPYLSPFLLPVDPDDFNSRGKVGLIDDSHRRDALLTDGGVYDNLGLETAYKRYKTLLVSDGGRRTPPEADPKDDWPRHSYRVIQILQQQNSSIRRRQLIGAFRQQLRSGAYWGVETRIRDFQIDSAFSIDDDAQDKLSGIDTRLAEIDSLTQQRLINLAFAIGDASIRKYYRSDLPRAETLPYQEVGI
ncbi:patatin-like phospholipase family protein [Bremerella cremea]